MKAIELFELQIERTKNLLDAHKKAYPKGRPASEGELGDLLRMVVVFAVAALDAYLHMRIIERVSEIMDMTKRFPEACVNRICKPVKQDNRERELIEIALKANPQKTLLGKLQRSLTIETFQKPEQIDVAFKMMEISDPWNKIDKQVNLKRGPKRKGRKETARKIVAELVKRRDDIVHEGDFYVYKKHHGNVKKIQRSKVAGQLKKLQRIVESIESITLPPLKKTKE